MIGRRMKRRANPRFLRGQGQYIADLRLPGMLHAAFIRSVYAHARVLDVDTSAAARLQQNAGDAKGALEEAPVVVSMELDIGRVSCMPIECRGLAARWSDSPGSPELTVYAATQTPHIMRHIYADMFAMPEEGMRV